MTWTKARSLRILRSNVLRRAILGISFAWIIPACFEGQVVEQAGPYLAHVVEGGPSLKKSLPESIANAHSWSEWVWFRTENSGSDSLIAGAGDPGSSHSRYFELLSGRPGMRFSGESSLLAPTPLRSGAWHMIVVTDDGKNTSLYVDGTLASSGSSMRGEVSAELQLAPDPPSSTMDRFSGEIGGFSVGSGSIAAADVAQMFANPPNFDAQLREENAKPWSIQTQQGIGLRAPQDPEEMPHGAAPEQARAKPLPSAGPTLHENGNNSWEIAANWRLLSNVGATTIPPKAGAQVSMPGFNDSAWLVATVPGTVLTTMVDRGIYPDPDFGMNNLAIPESLNKHDYWYRVEFPTPKTHGIGRRRTLHFAGINYAAEVWLNGQRLGQIRGAFRRGDFDVTPLLRSNGTNALAVRIAPPPHPGIPQEQSIKGGPGPDGGFLAIDGPTFVDTEGWDWIPAIRDRDTGLWQGVSLTETGPVTFGDPQVVTRLPLPDISSADVELHLPVHNSASASMHVIVTAAFEGVHVRMPATVPPGDTTLNLLPREFSQLHLAHPRLWWPNGYGSPNLYHLKLQLLADADAGVVSDEHESTFGVREVTYELTLFDHAGRLQRVEAIPAETLGKGYDAVDVHHADMRQTADGWASTIDPQAEGTSAIRPVTNEKGLTDLVIKVNGVRIAVRGGNWGMDDSRKRVSRERLEPYFRLHREANLNMIRNWVGQSTEGTFYQLADEYGMMVWNDFWASTENTDAEPDDPSLFVDNARDVVRRYRNHPSIVIWCGRNEGVPPPALNDMMIDMFREEDGTRFYSPSSNAINLRPSGPYKWREPLLYFSKLNRGFSVELGISSFPTREAFEHTVAPEDRWPLNDAWAYHDWHQSKGGDTHELMRELDLQLGPSASLAEFERRIQLFNYVDHQAIFEGMYAHLWAPNSGRMIWMTQPAWPSTMWQMYSSDYDTQASFYGVKKANAPLHVQMDLSDYTIAVVNTTLQQQKDLRITARIVSLANVTLDAENAAVTADANAVTPVLHLPVPSLTEKNPLVFVRLEMQDENGALVADNFYWIARDDESYRGLNNLAPASIDAQALAGSSVPSLCGKENTWKVHLKNTGESPSVAMKLTLFHADNTRVLPAYYSDNYISLLPGEERTIVVHAPSGAAGVGDLHFTLRGWNLPEKDVRLAVGQSSVARQIE
jgi:Exo-beta-D-glucosaminidase Ig-fold domain/Glycosyl hydrolases family 2, TIM barrel domain/Glycosyl hydrolases family 2/Concanavalin A-like lectin/glucanases superfamily/Glycosyl hydrolases family 2, sugar binding domain